MGISGYAAEKNKDNRHHLKQQDDWFSYVIYPLHSGEDNHFMPGIKLSSLLSRIFEL